MTKLLAQHGVGVDDDDDDDERNRALDDMDIEGDGYVLASITGRITGLL
eukprot:COSAG06_NODE_1609_length_8943_cov_90.568182_7_plen_49_part_00